MPLVLGNIEVDERELILQSQAGNKAAFGELVYLYHRRVIDVIYRMCGDAILAEDAAQVAFLNAWQRLSQFKPEKTGPMNTAFRNWLFRIGINAALDIIRGQKRQVAIDEIQVADPGESIEANLVKTERIRRVRQAVLGLPEASRAVLVLREYEDLSYREIAETLDIPTGTVMSRLNYARTLLAKQLQMVLEDS